MSEMPTEEEIANGIISAERQAQQFINDARNPNRASPRIGGEDPTSVIDRRFEDSGQILKFPHDTPKYYMTFGFEEYRRPNQFEGLKSNGVQDYIVLPMPQNLRDNNSLNYGDMDGSFTVEALTRI